MLALIPGILSALLPVLNKFLPDPNQQAQIQVELTKALTERQDELLGAMKDVMVADVAQDDKYTKRARPSVVYWSMAFSTFVAIMGVFGHAQSMIDALKQIPPDLWTLMTVGIGAFGVSRSVEKGITAVTKKGK
jgi:hypothetical protein